LITIISASAPASLTAFAESNSQLVPGKAGINTLGLATLIFETIFDFALYEKFSTLASLCFILQL
jgi:hypothetical protein